MSDLDPVERLLAASRTALEAVLDVEAGLREALIESRHAGVTSDLADTLNVETALAAIVPDQARVKDVLTPSEVQAESALGGDFGASLAMLDEQTRLAVRDHAALRALEDIFTIDLAAALVFVVFAHDPQKEAEAPTSRAGEVLNTRLSRMLNSRQAWVRVILDDAMNRVYWYSAFGISDFARQLTSRFVPYSEPAAGLPTTGSLRQAIVGMREVMHTRDSQPASDSLRATSLQTAGRIARDLIHDIDQHFGSPIDPTVSRARQRLADLDRARNDFITADLRGTDLTSVSLSGLRWSAATRWPSQEWRDRILLGSVEIAPGTYQVVPGGSAEVHTHVG